MANRAASSQYRTDIAAQVSRIDRALINTTRFTPPPVSHNQYPLYQEWKRSQFRHALSDRDTLETWQATPFQIRRPAGPPDAPACPTAPWKPLFVEDNLRATAPGTRPASIRPAPSGTPRAHLTLRERWHDPRFRREVLTVGVLLLVAFALRVAWLGTIPGNITADEADNLSTIFKAQVTGEPGFFGLDWKPQPAMSMYIFSGFMRVFGEDIFGMRMASALLSTLALLPFYLLARRVVQPAAALGGAALLATGLWYLNFSRSGWENVHTALYALVAAWALTVALERKQLRWFALAGVAAALGLYGYFAGRLIIVALLAYAPLALWWARGQRRPVLLGYGVLLAMTIMLFAPQVPAITEDRDLFNRRTDAVNVFDQPRPYLGETSDFGIIEAQTTRNLKGFFLFDGSVFTNGRYGPKGETLYDPVTSVLLLAGLLIGLVRWRQTALWWVLLAVLLLGTQIPSRGTPDGARAVIAAPFMYLFVTLTLDALIDLVRYRRRQLALAVVAVGVALLATINVWHYVDWVRSPETIEARQPAVELSDYDLWRTTLREGYAEQGPSFHVREWKQMVQELREQELTN